MSANRPPERTVLQRNGLFARARADLYGNHAATHAVVVQAANVLQKQPRTAERILSAYLDQNPDDVDALALFGAANFHLERYVAARKSLAECVERAPMFLSARFDYAIVLAKLDEFDAAMEQLGKILEARPGNALVRETIAGFFDSRAEHEEAAEVRRQIAEENSDSPDAWIKYGDSLRTLGRSNACVSSYLAAADLQPVSGAAYWNLANLQTFRFDDILITRMSGLLTRNDLPSADRIQLHFALGKAYDQQRMYAQAFDNFARGNALKRIGIKYDHDNTVMLLQNVLQTFSPEFFVATSDVGSPSREPVFVVGMQRSGSTLVEQILASHPEVEGLGELTAVADIAMRIGEEYAADSPSSPDASEPDSTLPYLVAVGKMPPARLRSLGEDYLAHANRRKTQARPFFVDKQCYNFWHLGLVHLILPKAKIIDVRRHPLACCFANFSTEFSFLMPFKYRQGELGGYYTSYVRLMAHFDRVLPGKIHRVLYEQLIAEPEKEIRRILEFLDLPFDESCLRFYANNRPVTSMSREQVRTPIFREAVDHWRNYEQWLAPLRTALEPVLDAWPDVPDLTQLAQNRMLAPGKSVA